MTTLWKGIEPVTLPGCAMGLLLAPYPNVALLLFGSIEPPHQSLQPAEQTKSAFQCVALTVEVGNTVMVVLRYGAGGWNWLGAVLARNWQRQVREVRLR